MITVLDVETTSFNNDPSPYNPSNYLVSVGYKSVDIEEYLCIKHTDNKSNACARDYIEEQLNMTTLLVGHNIKFDLSWLLECGFKYKGPVYDTMIYEYLKLGGVHGALDLSSCCSRYNIETKDDRPKEYIKDGIGFERMPWDVVEEYGRKDVEITELLYKKQKEELYAKSS